MTKMSDLPIDIVEELWKHILPPKDIESFAQVSKTTYALASPFLEKHRSLEKQYPNIDTTKFKGIRHGSLLFKLLKDILLKPHIALYVRNLWLSGWREQWDEPDNPTQDVFDCSRHHLPYPEQDMDMFSHAIRAISDLLPGDIDDWLARIAAGNEDAVIATLFVLLKDLRYLSLGLIPDWTRIFVILEHYASCPSNPVLPHLARVDLGDMWARHFQDISVMQPFLLLPSVKGILCGYVNDSSSGRFRIPRYFISPETSNLTYLEFNECGRIAQGLSCLFAGIKGLKVFKYNDAIRHGNNHGDDMSWILSALMNHTRHSLKRLEMHAETLDGSDQSATLRLFQVLKFVDIDQRFLGGRYMWDKLPTSLQRLKLRNVFLPGQPYSYIVEQIMKANHARLPNLTEVEIRIGLLPLPPNPQPRTA